MLSLITPHSPIHHPHIHTHTYTQDYLFTVPDVETEFLCGGGLNFFTTNRLVISDRFWVTCSFPQVDENQARWYFDRENLVSTIVAH